MIGERFKSNLCGWYTVIERIPHPKGARWRIVFDEVNGVKYSTITEKKHIFSGGIKNPYYPLKLGVACVGNVNSKEYPIEFNKWRAMIERCYDTNNNHYSTYGEKGVRVCDRWLCFENFLIDLPNLKGYNIHELQNLHLDKDIEGNGMLYSIENCILVSPTDNVKEMNRRTRQRPFKAIHFGSQVEIESDNQRELANMLGLEQSEISRALKNKKEYKGWRFYYKGEW